MDRVKQAVETEEERKVPLSNEKKLIELIIGKIEGDR